ncbi:MAG: M15 family metallopeptidase, partial [Gallionella sp.]
MSLVREQSKFLSHVAELIRKAPDYGLQVTASELYRTPEQQALHIKNGRSKTMNSQHLKRLAIDLNFFQEAPDGTLNLVYDGDNVRQLGTYWESLDPAANRWGGNWSSFKDTPHFERSESSDASVTGSTPAPSLTSASITVPATPTHGAKLLADTVGPRCANSPYDVESIQRLLNLSSTLFKLDEALKCDGKIGEKTLGAILIFQKAVLSLADPSGIIRPGDATQMALCTSIPKGFNETVLALTYLNSADSTIGIFTPSIAEAMAKYDINTPLRQVHFLAQIGHESGELRFREEQSSGADYDNRRDLGNIQPGDGPRYKGRGLIQLTGRANYTAYTNFCR